ncbi:MAG: sensor histidine kinase [Methanomicrobiales archaeon]|nr:sensor histidine kinase [Methanomicrobiales archaeon]
MPMKKAVRPSLPLAFYLLLAILLAMAPVVYLISFSGYASVRQGLEADTGVLQDQTEYSIALAMRLLGAGKKLLDDTLDNEMREGFVPFVAEYERAGGDPGAMDLARVKEDLGGRMDLYIINEDGIIEYTTHIPELGYDFRNIPDFYDRITDIRLSGAFSADRVVVDLTTGERRKYAYLPSPDRRYLLELGLLDPEFLQQREELSYADAVDEVVKSDPHVSTIRIFDFRGERIAGEAHPDDERRVALARQAYREQTRLEAEDTARGEVIRYIYIDRADSDHASDTSMVVEVAYNAKVVEEKIAGMFSRHIRTLFIGIFLIAALSLIAVRSLTRPMRTLVEDVDAIAGGDLDRHIQVGGCDEFAHLSESVSVMVASLKETLQKLQDSERALIRHNETLEDEIQERTAALDESDRMASLLLDIMGHDIGGANNIANIYSDLLLSDLEGTPEAEHLRKAKAGLAKSIEIVHNVNTIRHIGERSEAFKAVDLDRVIRDEIERAPTSRITCSGTTASVLADDLLPEVFSNLIGNAVKFGGPEVWITIQVEECDDEVLVSIEDTGPGIPDTVRPRLFDRLARGGGGASGSGLGLYICRTLIARYGGRMWAESREGGGTVVRFTLRKAREGGAP